jgi:hypothetical protein
MMIEMQTHGSGTCLLLWALGMGNTMVQRPTKVELAEGKV